MVGIVEAATIARWPVLGIIEAIMADQLKQVETVEPELKFKGVLLNPDEIRSVISAQKANDLLSTKDAALAIDITVVGLNTLARTFNQDGRPYLSICSFQTPRAQNPSFLSR